MFGSIYVGMAGMKAFSKGLDVISNNVANLNTMGFKAGLASFAEVVNRNSVGATLGSLGSPSSGSGVHVNADGQDFTEGEMRQTNNSLDTALDGNGFFVFEKDGQRYYSRAGQFEFDKDGYLTDRISGARVIISNEAASLGFLQVDPYRVFQPRATSEVKLNGNLTRAESGPKTATATITVLDTAGTQHTLTIKFTRADSTTPPATDPPATDPPTTDPPATDPPDPAAEAAAKAAKLLTWNVEILDDKQKVLGTGTIKFNNDGSPAADNTAISASMTPEGLSAFTFTLNFGAAGSYAGVTSLVDNTNANVQMLKQDGVAMGTISATTFDERGNLEITYSNGEKKKVGRLVLARFDSSGDLASVGDGLYVAQQGKSPQLGGGMDFGLGRVSGGNLELSNVDLSGQFTDLIIIQRGYQASSQMTSVANEMLQQLLSMQDHR